MNLSDYNGNDYHMSDISGLMSTSIHYPPILLNHSAHSCVICGSKSVGMNFGVLTCAPCKAFFRRNARRKELLELPCRHRDLSILTNNNIEFNSRTARYLQIRRCSSCRLRRCFKTGMKEHMIRSEAENERHKELVETNRVRRETLKQQLLEIHQLSIPQNIFTSSHLSDEIDWRHLSNIVYAYDTHCLKTFIRQRAEVIFNTPSDGQPPSTNPLTQTMSIILAASAFLKSLPVFYSLPRRARNYLCKTNSRPLIFPTIHELNQSCFSEPWQTAAYEATWQLMCGPELYRDFTYVLSSAEKIWPTDRTVIRLWIIILFFSTSLHYHDDGSIFTPILKHKFPIRQAQHAYATLLWKYLLHRYGEGEAVRIFSNLVHVYMKMQSVGFEIYTHLRTVDELRPTNDTLNRLVAVDISEE